VSKPANDDPLLIYNLFPRYFKCIDDWSTALPAISEMSFNSVFINPVHSTGLSGSLYAVKDYYRLNPLFLKQGQDPEDWAPVRRFLASCDEKGLLVIVDLVINHTAFDSDLVKKHPAWYKRNKDGTVVSPFAIDPSNPENVTVWGDLAEIDNEESKKRVELWKYWDSLVAWFQDMGVRGFRCDAAYKVPAGLWTMLIANAKQRDPQTVFLAETLGCFSEQITPLRSCGFDYLFNSSKWWQFDKSWAMDQHQANQTIAPSIGFAESHDTERLAAEQPGTLAMQKNRYFLASVFSRGLLMPMGYESGAKKKIDVVRGTPNDVEKPQWDLQPWIGAINRLKLATPLLREEGSWRALTTFDSDILFLEKSPGGTKRKAKPRIIFCINKDWNNSRTINRTEFPPELVGAKSVILPFSNPGEEIKLLDSFTLAGNEMAMFLSA
jgi:starch synthase (maltosyl-transferring)